MDKREKTEKTVRWIVFAVIAVLFIGGLLAELFLKVYYAIEITRGIPNTIPPDSVFQYLMNRTATYYGDEALYLWVLPVFGLRIMAYMPKEPFLLFLRWIPYGFIFLMPVIAAPLKRFKQIPFLLVGAFSFLQGAGILLGCLTAPNSNMLVPAASIPYFAEAVLMILTSVALWTKSKPFTIVMGVLCALFALASPLITATYSVLMRNALTVLNIRIPFQVFLRQLIQFPATLAVSPWPLFKGLSMTMVALITFTAPLGFRILPKKK